jgi:TetR/AcrR family transcriptional regulator, repressor of fatR-cypB operon
MPKIKDENKIASIQMAAMKLVIKTGFVGLKMADVAAGAGIATGTLYIYYSSKEELINDIFLHTKKEIAQLINNPNHASGTFYESIQKMWLAYFHFCNHNFEKMLFVEQFFYSGYIKEEVMQVAETYIEPLHLFLNDAQKQGFVRELDVEIIKAHLEGSIHQLIKISKQKNILLHDNTIKQCFEMAWSSIRK